MLTLGKSLPPFSYQPVLFQTRQSPNKSWLLWGNWAHFRAAALQFVPGHVFTRQQSGQYRGLQLRTSWDPLFTNSTHSAVSIDHLCLSFTFLLFPFHVVFASNSCQIILTSPMSLGSRATGTNTCVLPHSFQETKLDFLAVARALGKRFEATQQSRCAAAAVPSSSSSCNCYPLVSSSSVAQSLCWIQPQAFCSFPRNYSLYPASQPQPSTLLITGSAVSPSTCPLWE